MYCMELIHLILEPNIFIVDEQGFSIYYLQGFYEGTTRNSFENEHFNGKNGNVLDLVCRKMHKKLIKKLNKRITEELS